MAGRQSTTTEARVARQLCRQVVCPKCGAAPGQKCIGVRVKKRSASHSERWAAFKPDSIGAQSMWKEKDMSHWKPEVFDDRYGDEETEWWPEAVRCKRCGALDVRWRQQGGKWTLFSLQPGVLHTCPVVDDFEVVK